MQNQRTLGILVTSNLPTIATPIFQSYQTFDFVRKVQKQHFLHSSMGKVFDIRAAIWCECPSDYSIQLPGDILATTSCYTSNRCKI